MSKESIFDDISILGRVAYIIFSIETYLKENEDNEKWNILLDALWSFTKFDKCIDDYAYKVIECTPENILDEREDFTTFDYFNEKELNEFKDLYTESEYTKTIDYLMEQINEILACNLYTSVKPPEIYSLNIINETYLYIKQLLGEKTPSIEPFRIYSIYEHTCWRDCTLGKDVLLEQMNSLKL